MTFDLKSDLINEVMRDMTDIEKKIHKLNVDIVLNGPITCLDPIKDHRLKVAKFNIAKRELLAKESQKSEI